MVRRARRKGRSIEQLTEADWEYLYDTGFLFGEAAVRDKIGAGWQEVILELRRRGLALPQRLRVDLTADR